MPAGARFESWAAIKRASGPLTSFYLLAALDLHRDVAGDVVAVPPDHAIYRDVLLRTFRISLTVTLLCLALGFPVAYVLTVEPPRRANLLMILVLLPFWTSLLVRTSAWVVLLQSEGVVNRLMMWLGMIDEPLRLIYNAVGVHVAMTHVLLPFIDPAALFDHEGDSAHLHARRRQPGRAAGQRLRAGLSAAMPAGHWRRLPPRLHPGHRLTTSPPPSSAARRIR